MKFVIAPDKFKGSLSAIDFCKVVAKGIHQVLPNAEIIQLPLADGGDGTIAIVNHYLNGKIIECNVNDPFFRPITATYLYAESSKTAFIEMAEASGLKLLKNNELDCKNATTFGTGELIKDALGRGAKTIILGIGGSATNDCGVGMATALGYRFLDAYNNEVHPVGKNLSNIVTINDSNIHAKLNSTIFKIACDVTNPLYDKNGAAYVYAAQKGANQADIELLDQGLKDFASLLNEKYAANPQEIAGAGAAGGMGIASNLFLKGTLDSGIDLVMDIANFNTHIHNADYIITGEGKLDQQTLSGKTIYGVLKKAKRHYIKVAAFCGVNTLTKKELEQLGLDYTDEIFQKANNLEDAMINASDYIEACAINFAIKIDEN